MAGLAFPVLRYLEKSGPECSVRLSEFWILSLGYLLVHFRLHLVLFAVHSIHFLIAACLAFTHAGSVPWYKHNAAYCIWSKKVGGGIVCGIAFVKIALTEAKQTRKDLSSVSYREGWLGPYRQVALSISLQNFSWKSSFGARDWEICKMKNILVEMVEGA